MDERVDAINDHGMIAAPVLIWTVPRIVGIPGTIPSLNPGMLLHDDQILVLAKYLVARYGAHQVVWIVGGDGDYRGEKAERWKKIGRSVLSPSPKRLATMHPIPWVWVAEEFRDEPWYSFHGYQSCHGVGDEQLRWLTEGPPSQEWRKGSPYPIINLEPNYEALSPTYAGTPGKPFDAHAVRRASYWSLLVHPPAGVTYGAHGIWSWELKPQIPMNHPTAGVAPPWHEAIKLTGSTSMKHLKDFFNSFQWWKLRPAQEMIVDQPGFDTPCRFIAAAVSEEKDFGVVYLPEGGKVHLKTNLFSSPVVAEWFNPASGERTPAGTLNNQGTHEVQSLGEGDWVLWLERKIT
jgi:hypothetical protein